MLLCFINKTVLIFAVFKARQSDLLTLLRFAEQRSEISEHCSTVFCVVYVKCEYYKGDFMCVKIYRWNK